MMCWNALARTAGLALATVSMMASTGSPVRAQAKPIPGKMASSVRSFSPPPGALIAPAPYLVRVGSPLNRCASVAGPHALGGGRVETLAA